MIAMALPNNRKLISTADAAKILGVSMSRMRQLAIDGKVWSEHAAANARVFDEAEIRKRAKAPRTTGRKRGGFRSG